MFFLAFQYRQPTAREQLPVHSGMHGRLVGGGGNCLCLLGLEFRVELVLMGFAVLFHTRPAQQYIEVTPPPPPSPPHPQCCCGKHLLPHIADEKPVFIASSEIGGLISALLWNKRLPRVIWHNSDLCLYVVVVFVSYVQQL